VSETGLNLSPEREARLRQELKKNESVCVYRRAAALLAIHRGNTVNEVAQLLGVTRQTIYNWVSTYGTGNRQCGLDDAERPGRPSVWTPELQASLGRALDQFYRPPGCGSTEWTVSSLRKHLESDTGRQISETVLRKKLEIMGYFQKRRRYVIRLSPPEETTKAQLQQLSWGVVPRPLETDKKDKLIAA
jgi:transposase